VHRELSVCYSKQGKPELAVELLREAVRLDPNDAEAWSNLGGALRRLGMAGAPDSYDRKALEDAHNSYQAANRLNRYDLYAGLNVARLDLLLSIWESERLEQAKEGFRKHIYLCRHMIEENPRDYWRYFDLVDALLFSGEYEEAHSVLNNAIKLLPDDRRQDIITSVVSPLRNYLTAGVAKATLSTEIKKIVDKLEVAVG